MRSVINTILTRHKLNADRFDIQSVIKTLQCKIKKMTEQFRKLRSAGGKSLKNLLANWTSSDYILKLPHKTGSPTKRKLEEDLQNEHCKLRD